MKLFVIFLLSFCGVVNASQEAAILDTVSTVSSIMVGASEANPIGLLTIPLKVVAISHADNLPEGEKQVQHLILTTIWKGATINNLCAIPVVLSGGSFTPICLILGGIIGYNDWVSTQEQRTFWLLCKEMKKENQRLECKWNDPNKDS